MRRLAMAIARAVALFILVTGIYGALAIALPRWPVLNRSIVALLVGVTIFEILRRPRRAVTVPVPAQDLSPVVIDGSVELAEARATIEKLRDALETARNRESEVRSEYERESEHLQRAASRALEEIQRTRASHDELRGHLESERAKLTAAQQELESARSTEQRLGAAMAEIEAMRADRQRVARELEHARQRLEVDKTKLADLQREVDLTHATSQKVVQTNEALKKQLDDERQRLQAEVQRVQADRDKMQSEARSVSSRVEELIAQLDRERKLSQELGATRGKFSEENAALKNALAEAVAAHAGSRTEVESLKKQLAAAEQEREGALQQLDAEWSAKLQKIVSELAADHENALGDAIADREAARAEVRSAQQQIVQAQQERESALKELDEQWSAKLQKIVNGLTSDHENDIGEAIGKREEARAEARAMQIKIGKLESDIETLKEQLEANTTAPMLAMVDEKALREQIEAEWSEKLQKIVNGLTSDHENDIGEAIAKREEARAEARALQMKVGKLEGDVEALKEQLDANVTAPMPAMIDEKALREQIEAEWSAKLQTIVSHIASDHEADIGKAIEEREAARAEVRNLNLKMTSLQQKLESERQAREALQTRYRDIEEQLRNAPTQPMRALVDPFPVQEPEPQQEEKARADVLEFAEQAFEALKRASSPGTIPVPRIEEKKARILIVHHDPRFRAMWRDSLEQSGFGVQTAADGVEGLRVVKTERPDAVIADVAMPKMDGRELCQMIKSNPETAEVKVILLSGMYTNDIPLPGEKSEFEPDELLRKPVKLEVMKTALSNLLAAAS
ncbi:MAG TPA: response regulator [Thermoanaerobaculia bacterium]|nr:response regulator [Thermoanaerobaculia bacterium]